jgi:hypothetical protein
MTRRAAWSTARFPDGYTADFLEKGSVGVGSGKTNGTIYRPFPSVLLKTVGDPVPAEDRGRASGRVSHINFPMRHHDGVHRFVTRRNKK